MSLTQRVLGNQPTQRTYVTSVTIGRNVGDSPMPDARWSRFVEYVRASLDYHTTEDDDLLKVHYATGSWQGIEEESAKITLLSNYPVPPEIVRGQLRIIAAFYEQDAIALTIGKSEVITPL